MGALFDLFKEIPLSSVLKEKLGTLEAKYGALETENSILKDDLRQAKAEIVKLKEEINRLTHTDDLEEKEKAILALYATRDRYMTAEEIAHHLQLNPVRADYYLTKLVGGEYIRSPPPIVAGPTNYYITQKGREFLIKNNLI